jgi:D-glycero-D-manno-heptose 1,7-bisphosphate phosphatase
MDHSHFLLLDRDGVLINNDCYYVTSISQVQLLDGVKEAVQKLWNHNYKLCVVSNQGGISKGLYTIETVHKIHNYIQNLLGNGTIYWYVCPHHDKDHCSCRKHNLTASNIWMVGDSKIDIQAGKAVGCKTALVQTGNGLNQTFEKNEEPDLICPNFANFVDLITQ